MRSITRSVAIAVGGIGGGTTSGELFATSRLRELPGGGVRQSAVGLPYAAACQFAQSPRRKQFTARCAATYSADGNCYAPSDTAHSWNLDINSADSSDPSHGR